MTFTLTREWLERQLDGPQLEDCACPYCGAMAGCCSDYPNCPNGPKENAVTTTVKVLIEGNKACEVKVESPGTEPGQVSIVKPGEFATKLIHGEQSVSVKETGDFL